MLIFTRKKHEKFYIGNDIKIAILDIVDHQVRIGIEAPRDIPVHREEIYYRIIAQKDPDKVTDSSDSEDSE